MWLRVCVAKIFFFIIILSVGIGPNSSKYPTIVHSSATTIRRAVDYH